jgi:hypothetical protein
MLRFIPIYLIPFARLVVVAVAAASCAPSVAIAQNDFLLEDSQFDSWLFGDMNRNNDVDSQIALTLEAVDRTCHLSSEKAEKLRLAARGDYARFEREADQLRSELVGKSYDQNKIGEVYQQIQPLATKYREGLLGRSSLYVKVVHSVLTLEQLVEFDAAEQEWLQSRHVAKIKLYVAGLDRCCPLSGEQRQALVDLLIADTRPPLRSSQYDMYVVQAQAVNIPREKFEGILDDAQLQVFDKSLQQGRALAQHLRKEGVLADE